MEAFAGMPPIHPGNPVSCSDFADYLYIIHIVSSDSLKNLLSLSAVFVPS